MIDNHRVSFSVGDPTDFESTSGSFSRPAQPMREKDLKIIIIVISHD
jgi:hypothetical protein